MKRISKRIAAVISLLLCVMLYLSFLTAFSEILDTYVCYVEKDGKAFHTDTCMFLGEDAYESTVHEAQKKFDSCKFCHSNIYDERYKVTITARNYVTPIVISVPISLAVYALLTIGNKERNKI